MKTRDGSGFTILEIAIVIGIVGILAVVAIPAFVKYVRRSKTSEVHENLEKISIGAKAYFVTEHTDAVGDKVPRQFPDPIALTPASPCCAQTGKVCFGTNWEAWKPLSFAIDSGTHYYQYEFATNGKTEVGAEFKATAIGNLDCDNVQATYYRQGRVLDGEGHIQVPAAVADNELE